MIKLNIFSHENNNEDAYNEGYVNVGIVKKHVMTSLQYYTLPKQNVSKMYLRHQINRQRMAYNNYMPTACTQKMSIWQFI